MDRSTRIRQGSMIVCRGRYFDNSTWTGAKIKTKRFRNQMRSQQSLGNAIDSSSRNGNGNTSQLIDLPESNG